MRSGKTETWRSLATAAAGQAVEVREIRGARLREFCRELGVREGDVLRCRVSGATHKILVTASGRTIVLEQDWARFIDVFELPAAEARTD